MAAQCTLLSHLLCLIYFVINFVPELMPFSRRKAMLERSQLLSPSRRKVEGKIIITLSRFLAAIALQEQLLIHRNYLGKMVTLRAALQVHKKLSFNSIFNCLPTQQIPSTSSLHFQIKLIRHQKKKQTHQ
jgi:hypothetical protein